MPRILPVIGGGGGSGASSWTTLLDAECGGSGGVIADGGTVTLDGQTFTLRGTGTVVEQVAGGLNLTRSASTKTVLGVPLADLADYDPTAQYAIAVRAKVDTWPTVNGNHITGGVWRDNAGTPREMIHAGPYYTTVSGQTAMVARRENTAGAFDTESFQLAADRFTMSNYIRWIANILPVTGVSSRFSNDASAQPMPAATEAFSALSNGTSAISTVAGFTFDTIGIQMFLTATTDVTIERIAIFRRLP